jgi:hypothetical protein
MKASVRSEYKPGVLQLTHSDGRKGGNELMSDNIKQQKKRSTEFLIYNTVSSEQKSIFLNMNFIVYYWTHIRDIIMELSVKHSATHKSACMSKCA